MRLLTAAFERAGGSIAPRRSMASVLATVACCLGMGIGWLYLAPPQVGGSTHYLVVSGTSMEPSFQPGDLTLVRRAASYGVGDVVAFRSTTLDAVVLHRVVDVDAGKLTTKGDSNSWLDPEKPRASEVMGRVTWKLPDVGTAFISIATPTGAAVILAVILAVAVMRRQKGPAASRTPLIRASVFPARAPILPPRAFRAPTLMRAATVTVALGVAATIALCWPASRSVDRSETIRERAEFAYAGSARISTAYPAGKVSTGDPLFTRLVTTLDISLEFAAAIEQPVTLTADLGNEFGWRRSLTLPTVVTHNAGRTTVTGQLDVAGIQRMFDRLVSETGLPSATGTVAVGTDLHGWQPRLTFNIDPVQLRPDLATLTATHDRHTVRTDRVSTALTVGAHRIPLTTLRVIFAVLFSFALIATTLIAARRRGRRVEPIPLSELAAHIDLSGYGVVDSPAAKASEPAANARDTG